MSNIIMNLKGSISQAVTNFITTGQRAIIASTEYFHVLNSFDYRPLIDRISMTFSLNDQLVSNYPKGPEHDILNLWGSLSFATGIPAYCDLRSGSIATQFDAWMNRHRQAINQVDKLYLSDFTNVPLQIAQLTQLKELYILRGEITTLPPEICSLPNLKKLTIQQSLQLIALPSEISRLTQLEELCVSGTCITTLPAEIGGLQNLNYLRVTNSSLLTVPAEIGQLHQLKKLQLGSNKLASLPPEIGKLTNLTDLNVSGNCLTVLPAEIGQLHQLKKLQLGSNKFASLPPEIGKLTNLTDLNVSGNCLTVTQESLVCGNTQQTLASVIQNLKDEILGATTDEVKSFCVVFKKHFFKEDAVRYTEELQPVLSHLIDNPNYPLLETLIETGIDLNTPFFHSGVKATLLYHACCKELSSVFIINHLINKGADVSFLSFNGLPPIRQLYNKTNRGRFTENHLKPVTQELLQRMGFHPRVLPPQRVVPFLLRNGLTDATILQSLLQTKVPSGYVPLKTPLGFDPVLLEEAEREIQKVSVFDGTDVEVVADGCLEPLKIHQVRRADAKVCQLLFERIKAGNLCFQWQNEVDFEKEVLESIKKLLTRPSGRALIYGLVQSNRPIFLAKSADRNAYFWPGKGDELPDLILVDLKQSSNMLCFDSLGNKKTVKAPSFMQFGHEFLHALLRLQVGPNFEQQLLDTKAPHSEWDNLNEQLVITGLENESYPCDNMLRFEFGLPARCGH
jgi:hypothetical protein